MDHDALRIKISDDIAKTEKLIGEYQEMTKPVSPDAAIGRISRIDAINNKSVTEYALRQAEDKLDKLKSALSRVASPDFGICSKCKAPIPAGRLLLRPESRYCVNCAQ